MARQPAVHAWSGEWHCITASSSGEEGKKTRWPSRERGGLVRRAGKF
ncbi:MAG: hypothetical protein WCQ50_12985 [Spirochaetota bacterium]